MLKYRMSEHTVQDNNITDSSHHFFLFPNLAWYNSSHNLVHRPKVPHQNTFNAKLPRISLVVDTDIFWYFSHSKTFGLSYKYSITITDSFGKSDKNKAHVLRKCQDRLFRQFQILPFFSFGIALFFFLYLIFR